MPDPPLSWPVYQNVQSSTGSTVRAQWSPQRGPNVCDVVPATNVCSPWLIEPGAAPTNRAVYRRPGNVLVPLETL